MHYVNPTLEESEFDIAIINVSMNCKGDIDQINNILWNIERIVYKCRQYGVKNVFLSGLTITNRLPEQLIKGFNMSIRNICSQTPDCDYIDNANMTPNEVCRDGLHLSGKGKYVLINNYLDKVLNFLEVVQCPRRTHTGNSPVNENHWQDDLQILKDAILNSPKNLVIAKLNLNSLKNKINDLRILIQDIPLDYFVLSEAKLDKSFPTAQFHIPGYEIKAKKDRNKYGVV